MYSRIILNYFELPQIYNRPVRICVIHLWFGLYSPTIWRVQVKKLFQNKDLLYSRLVEAFLTGRLWKSAKIQKLFLLKLKALVWA